MPEDETAPVRPPGEPPLIKPKETPPDHAGPRDPRAAFDAFVHELEAKPKKNTAQRLAAARAFLKQCNDLIIAARVRHIIAGLERSVARPSGPASAGQPPTRTLGPLPAPSGGGTLGPGLMATYYRSAELAAKNECTRLLEERIEARWGRGAPNKFTPAKHFAVRWTGKLKVKQKGPYVIHVEASGGVRLAIGGKVVLDSLKTDARTQAVRLTLEPGWHDFSLTYTKLDAQAQCVLLWELPGVIPKQPVGPDAFFHKRPKPPPPLPPALLLGPVRANERRPGWLGTYVSGLAYREKRVVRRRVDRRIWFTWGRGRPMTSLPFDGFCIRWVGQIKVDQAGRYVFEVDCSNGARWWMDGKLVINAWDQEKGKRAGALELAAGYHDVTLDYWEGVGSCWIKLRWSRQGGFSRQPLPASVLFHHPAQVKKLPAP